MATKNNTNNTASINALNVKYPNLPSAAGIKGHFQMQRVGTKREDLIAFIKDNIRELNPDATDIVTVGNSFVALTYADEAKMQLVAKTYHITTFGGIVSLVDGTLSTFSMLCMNKDNIVFPIDDPLFDIALATPSLSLVAASVPMTVAAPATVPAVSTAVAEDPAPQDATAPADPNAGKAFIEPYANPNKGGEVKSYKITGDLKPILKYISKMMVGKHGKAITKVQAAFYLPVSRMNRDNNMEKFVAQCKKAGVEVTVKATA